MVRIMVRVIFVYDVILIHVQVCILNFKRLHDKCHPPEILGNDVLLLSLSLGLVKEIIFVSD